MPQPDDALLEGKAVLVTGPVNCAGMATRGTMLADWGPEDPELSRALGDLATSFVNQDPQHVTGPLGLSASVS